MVQVNDYLRIKPIKEGMIAAEGNEYLVLDAPINCLEFEPGCIIIVEDNFVIRVSIGGKEAFFCKQESVLAVVDELKKSN